MTRKVFGKSELIRQLRELGLETGDTVLVRVDFGRLGRIERPGDRTLIESLIGAVGKRGTIIASTHSPTQFILKRDRSYIFDPATAPCVTGRFAESVLKWEGAFRSSHPTCSMAAIGPLARDILAQHDHTSTCFGPIQALIRSGGKMLIAGCTTTSPGFVTVHYAYEHCGLAHHSFLSGLIGCYFRNGQQVRWFRQRDIAGCSMGFHKFYPLYRDRSVLRSGPVGEGESFLARAADAFTIEQQAIARDARFSLCDRPTCSSCRATKWFNLGDLPGYYWTRLTNLLMRFHGKGRQP